MAINFLNDGSFPDNAKLQFGNSNDLQLYHDSSNSYVVDNGTGNLIIAGQQVYITNAAGSEYKAQFNTNGAVNLYYDNSKKFETTSVGATITGTQTISTIDQIGSDTDKFLMSDSGEVKYVTGTNLRSYIGAGTGDGTVTGSGVANKVAYWSSSSALTYNNGFGFNGITLSLAGDNHVLSIGTGGAGTTSLFAWTGDTFYIQQDSASGNIQIETDDFVVKNHGASETYIRAQDNSSVQLYYNNSEKLETQSDGIQVTGNIDIDSNGEIELDGNGGIKLNISSTSSEGNGIIIKLHSTSTTFGKLYYKSNFAAAWTQADADSDGATRMLGVALGSTSSNDGMLLQGIIRIASHGLSAGAPIYVSTTAGEFTTTAPSGSGDYVRVVGYTIDSNLIYFNPSGTWVEVA
tara:strand:+ start:605 stop:1819 length:1215 start_codon:yes stop_codon:yes gene_type:complete